MRQFFSSKFFVFLVVGVIVLAVGYGIFLAGSPATQRILQFDQRRVSDLQQISFAIDAYWGRNEKPPETLEDLKDSRYFIRSITDPATEEPYEYRILSGTTYELCAVFEKDSFEQRKEFGKPFSEQVWEHGVGKTCFGREIREVRLIPEIKTPRSIPLN